MGKPDITPAYLTDRQAAQYLGVSKSHFLSQIRRHVPMIDLKPPTSRRSIPRWHRSDLDTFAMARRKDA